MDLSLFAVALARIAGIVFPELEPSDALYALSARFLSAGAHAAWASAGRPVPSLMSNLFGRAASTAASLGFDATMSEEALERWLRERYARDHAADDAARAAARAAAAAARTAAAVCLCSTQLLSVRALCVAVAVQAEAEAAAAEYDAAHAARAAADAAGRAARHASALADAAAYDARVAAEAAQREQVRFGVAVRAFALRAVRITFTHGYAGGSRSGHRCGRRCVRMVPS